MLAASLIKYFVQADGLAVLDLAGHGAIRWLRRGKRNGL